jgi:hypothetical protein
MTRAWPQVADFFVERIVFLRRDDDHFADESRGCADNIGEFADLRVGADRFAVADAGFEQVAGDGFVGVGAGDDQRTEEVALAAFVDPEVRGEALGVVEIFVTKPRLPEDGGFEGELDEFLGLFALDHGFGAFLVDGHGESGLLGEVEGVGAGFEFEILLLENAAKGGGLVGGERHGVGAERWHGSGILCPSGRKGQPQRTRRTQKTGALSPFLCALCVLCGSKI